MKYIRALIFVLLCIGVLTPVSASFTDWQIGPAVMIHPTDLDDIKEAVSFGIDGRFTYRSVSGSLLTLYCRDICPQDHEGIRINTYPQIGAVGNIDRFRVGVYAGPRIGYVFNTQNGGDPHSFDAAIALRFNGDINMGPVSISLFYLMEGRDPLSDLTWDNWHTYFQDHRGRLGLSLLATLR